MNVCLKFIFFVVDMAICVGNALKGRITLKLMATRMHLH